MLKHFGEIFQRFQGKNRAAPRFRVPKIASVHDTLTMKIGWKLEIGGSVETKQKHQNQEIENVKNF